MIVKEAEGLADEYDSDNGHSEKYAVRTTDMENLEASDAFFAGSWRRSISGACG